ncbi:MAG: DNA internalization-related competence protein ComEC/Rec2 [Bacteroidota bacterium]
MQTPSLMLNHPIPRLTILCFSGFLTGSLIEPWIGRFSPLLLLSSLLLAVHSLLLSRYPLSVDPNARRFCTIALILFTVWRGVEPIQQHREKEEWISRYLVPLEESVTLSGVVKESGQTRRGNVWIELKIQDVSLERERTRGTGRIRLYTDETDSTMGAYAKGDRMISRVNRIHQSRQRAPMLFDPQAWRLREGFHAEASLLEVISVHRPSVTNWKRPVEIAASRIRARLNRIPLEEPMKSTLRAMLTGDRSGLDGNTDDQLSRAGVAHGMAVSGLHVGLVLAPFWWLFVKVRSQWSGLVVWLVTGLVLLLYVEIADQSPSVSRAALMSWMAGWIMIPMRRLPTTQLLLLAGMILLLWKPTWLRHPGFQLSMVAVWSILMLYAPVERKLRTFLTAAPIRKTLSLVLLTAILQIALAPLLVWWFGEISIVAPVANLLVVPLVPLLMLSGWVWVSLDFLSMDGVVLLRVVQWMMEWVLFWTERLSRFSWATVTPEWWVWLVLVPALGLSAKGYSWVRDSRKRILFWQMLTILLLLGSLFRNVKSRELVVTVLDVGQGDAIHIETPNGSHLLVDNGPEQASEQVLIPYLKAAGVDRIDVLMITHPHADHAGGFASLVNEIAIGSYVHMSGSGNRLLSEVRKTGRVPARNIRSGEWLNLDPAIRLYILDSRVVDATVNNHSLVIKLVYGETSMLFTGDAERRQELSLVRTYGTWLDVDVLKAGHHGSRTSSRNLFLRFVNPSWTVISAGWMNRYGHPHQETLTRLHRQGSGVRTTAVSGSVRLVSDGFQIEPKRWN